MKKERTGISRIQCLWYGCGVSRTTYAVLEIEKHLLVLLFASGCVAFVG